MNGKQRFFIVITIISTVCLSILLVSLAVIFSDHTPSDHSNDLVADIVSALIVIVSMVIGNRANGKEEE